MQKFFSLDSCFRCPCSDCTHVLSGISSLLCDKLNLMQIEVGITLTPTSGRRCQKHNAAIGGAPDSEHLPNPLTDVGNAVDIATFGKPYLMHKIIDAAMIYNLSCIAVNKSKPHVHVDLRAISEPIFIIE